MFQDLRRVVGAEALKLLMSNVEGQGGPVPLFGTNVDVADI